MVNDNAGSSEPHILIVDDDRDIRSSLREYLARHRFRTTTAANGKEVDRVLGTCGIDLIVLDVMLPGEDGFSICRRVQETSRTPVILLTARVEHTDRIVGLEIGADDYVTKPFDPRELVARIKSVLRRSAMLPPHRQNRRGRVKLDRWHFDFSRKELVAADNSLVRLSSSEHLLLITFIEHAGVTLSRDQLLDLTKGRQAQVFDRSIDNQISRLRRKLEADPKNPRIILTAWGGGYSLAPEVEWLA